MVIDDPKLDSTASHPSSSSHSLPYRVICHPGHPMPTIMGGLVLLRMLCLLLLSLSVGRQSVSVSATVTAVSESSFTASRGFGYGHDWTSVTAPLSATAETIKIWFRSVSIGL